MSIERQLQQSLKAHAGSIPFDNEIDRLVLGNVRQVRQIRRSSFTRLRKRLLLTGLAVVLALPVTAFAFPDLADRIYGSYEKIVNKGVNITKAQYAKLNLKFSGIQKELGDDYPLFEAINKKLTALSLQYADANGMVDYSALSKEDYEKFVQLFSEQEPYFDRLNRSPSKKEYLTPEEYRQYIEAHMLWQTVMAKSKTDTRNGPPDVQKLSEELQTDLNRARETMREMTKRTYDRAPRSEPLTSHSSKK
ncbi:DUF3600 domain-containing protein [Paenibacillus sp. MBLB4367]|uniref:DUF3600 domain-containing protein n=1 Tax=Paenibacillus sp. MBLB4367 TaxID=3384767 RepID=UPI0039080A9A